MFLYMSITFEKRLEECGWVMSKGQNVGGLIMYNFHDMYQNTDY